MEWLSLEKHSCVETALLSFTSLVACRVLNRAANTFEMLAGQANGAGGERRRRLVYASPLPSAASLTLSFPKQSSAFLTPIEQS